MLEHPEKEFTYHYGRGVSKRKDLEVKCNKAEMESKGRQIKRIEITVDFPEPVVDGLNIQKKIRKLRKQYQELTDAKVRIRYLGEKNQIDLFADQIDMCIKEECKKLKNAANPKDELKKYIRQIRWKNPELAIYLQRRMSKVLNLDN